MDLANWHRACSIEELPVGARKILEIDGKSIGIFNVRGTVVAVLNVCPHELAPVCAGSVGGTTAPARPGEYPYEREGQILRCPWHGWEFDLLSGECLVDKRKLRKFPVIIRDGQIFVALDQTRSSSW